MFKFIKPVIELLNIIWIVFSVIFLLTFSEAFTRGKPEIVDSEDD